MAIGSNNPFPSVLIVESTVPASPAAGDQRIYIDSADHKLKRVNSSGTVTTVEGAGGGGFTPSFVAKTANYTLLTTDTGILGGATGGAITLTLPTAVAATQEYFIFKGDSSANTVTVATTSSQTINGASTVVLSAQYAGVVLLSDGANWRIVAQLPVGGSTALTTASAQLSADVAITTAGTYYDGPSVSLAAGTWLVIATLTFNSTTGSSANMAKLWDGTTVAASSGTQRMISSAFNGEITLTAIVSPGSTTTFKASATSDVGGAGSIKAALSLYGVGNNASGILAVKIA